MDSGGTVLRPWLALPVHPSPRRVSPLHYLIYPVLWSSNPGCAPCDTMRSDATRCDLMRSDTIWCDMARAQVVLSLVQQLGFDLDRQTALKLAWLRDAAMGLDPSDGQARRGPTRAGV